MAAIKVGDKVKCNVTPLDIYYGEMEVTKVSNDSYTCKCTKGDLQFDKSEIKLV
jgi:hypothetical protein